LSSLELGLQQEAVPVWHKDRSLDRLDALIIPGGFSYGDYLRAGAIARFSPIMEAVRDFAEQGGPVLAICNGFQIATEAGLLPGALLRNGNLSFRSRWVHVRVENDDTPFTTGIDVGTVLRLPIAHGEGRYFVTPEQLAELERDNRVVFRYVEPVGPDDEPANPNDSVAHIAGVCNARGNVVGLMPHPERAYAPELGGDDGLRVLGALLRTGLAAARA
jgi:phosphoribosylformylglycinamidine synthase